MTRESDEQSGQPMNSVALVSPPLSKACEPEPALVALASHLARAGIGVSVHDANLSVQARLLSPASLAGAAESLHGSRRTAALRSVRSAGVALEALAGGVAWPGPKSYRASLDALSQAFKCLSAAHGGRISISDYLHPALSPLSSADLARAAREPELLPTARFLEEAAEEALHCDPKVIGISVTYLSQALHGWALAGVLRRKGFRGTLLLGGALASSWRGALAPDSPAFEAVDAIVAGPGEKILEESARTGRVPDLPGVLAPGHGVWRPAPDPSPLLSFDPEPLPIPWGRYLAPGGILPVAASRGCYWARCAFCPEADSPYRAADPEKLARAVVRLAREGGPRMVHFTDNALSPRHLRVFARILGPEGIVWYGFARLEKKFADPGFMEELKAGGCAMLQFGVESATPRLLELYRKGVTVELAEGVVRAASRAGVRVFGYFLFGAPTETADEARRTLDWMRENASSLTFVNLSIMNLPREGEILKAPGEFGLESLSGGEERNDLSLYVGYSGAETIDRREIRRLLAEAKRDADLRDLINRSPRGFTSNHAAFAPL